MDDIKPSRPFEEGPGSVRVLRRWARLESEDQSTLCSVPSA